MHMLRFLLLAILFLAGTETRAQSLTNFPSNSKHPADYENLPRPRLSLVGFSSPNVSHGYGVRQILERTYGPSMDPLVRSLYVQIITDAFLPVPTGPDRASVNERSRIFQARAFEALMSYVLERNGFTSAQIYLSGFPGTASDHTHAAALNRFKAMAGAITSVTDGDAVKRVTSISNTARAWDLYLALEVAYTHYGGAPSALLTTTQKESIITRNRDAIYGIHEKAGSFDEGSRQPGNWPMKQFVAGGYAALGFGYFGSGSSDVSKYYKIISDAFRSAYSTDGAPSRSQWTHWLNQTNGGKRYWAEGAYYFEFALGDVLPFWHATRAMGRMPSYVTDPFSSDWFLNPLEWLADVSMPGGFTPPLDDGNKHPINVSSVLRWTVAYASNSVKGSRVGSKFATINSSFSDPNDRSDANLRLVEIAIPRILAPQTSALPTYVGNSSGQSLNESAEQQLVVRHPAGGNEHYLLLNGEHGGAIDWGEGHEHPDNMQLLYNVGGLSYLVDSGYNSVTTERDKGLWLACLTIHTDCPWYRSAWNNHHDHNVMRGYRTIWLNSVYPQPSPGNDVIGGGGDQPPYFDRYGGNTHPVSDHMQDTQELHRTTLGNVDVLHSRMNLRSATSSGTLYDFGDYKRDVLFVRDPAGPYLVDLNMLTPFDTGETNTGYIMAMTYHGLSDNMAYTPGQHGAAIWQGIDGTANNHLLLFPATVENNMLTEGHHLVSQDQVQERFETPLPVKRLDVYATMKNSNGEVKIRSHGHTTVAFIKALTNTNAGQLGSIVSNLPQRYYTQPVGVESALPIQAWAWTINSGTVDFSSLEPRSGTIPTCPEALHRTIPST